ncbi:MAG: sialate O-acetylesterase [Verrucomicrobia bacterium]|nr:sialate O-acetylesterase [Verrucomicrobiota bacterium]
MKTTAGRFARLVVLGCFLILATQLHSTPLKVFILAGQSNMQGHAKVETFDYIGDDPTTATLLKEMRGADGKPRVLENVWISSIGCLGDAYSDLTEKTGQLTAGFGAPENKIGPEFTFGITLEKLLGEPILLIKTAWGGRSLHTDFRPPSAGPYVPTPEEAKRWAEKPERKTKTEAATGVFYREMVAHVKKVLADPKRVCPAYDAKQGYEIAGFVWLQGFNDLVSSDTYPPKPGEKVRDYSKYGVWLADLIRDVRKDLAAPKLPVVIGVLGVDGLKANDHTKAFRTAMAAPAALPEFEGNVVAIETAPFWSEELGAIAEKKEKVSQMAHLLKSKNKKEANADGTMTEQQQRDYVKAYEAKIITPAEAAAWKRGASNGGYHYLGCAKTFALMGKAFAEANLQLMKAQAAR